MHTHTRTRTRTRTHAHMYTHTQRGQAKQSSKQATEFGNQNTRGEPKKEKKKTYCHSIVYLSDFLMRPMPSRTLIMSYVLLFCFTCSFVWRVFRSSLPPLSSISTMNRLVSCTKLLPDRCEPSPSILGLLYLLPDPQSLPRKTKNRYVTPNKGGGSCDPSSKEQKQQEERSRKVGAELCSDAKIRKEERKRKRLSVFGAL